MAFKSQQTGTSIMETISVMPWRPGLVTAGQQTTVPEQDVWKAINTTSEMDGMVRKRPALEQWGQTIKEPNTTDLLADGTTDRVTDYTFSVLKPLTTTSHGFTITDASSEKVTASSRFGELTTNVGEATGNEKYTLSLELGSSAFAGLEDDWSLRFSVRGNNLSDYTAAGTVGNTFVFRGRGNAATSAKEFAIWGDGLYYEADDSSYTLVDNTELVGGGGWQTLEIQCDATGDTLVYVNETLADTIRTSDIKDATFEAAVSNVAFEFEWEVEGTEGSQTQYSTKIAAPMYIDSIEYPFKVQEISDLESYRYMTSSSATRRAVMMAAGSYVYHDMDLQGQFRPILAKEYANLHFCQYRDTIVWVDSNGGGASTMWQWDGRTYPEKLGDAPKATYAREHQKRLLAWGDPANPRRLYISGDRLPNVWFSPSPTNTEDEFDVLLDAAYIEIESWGVAVKDVVGDFHGLAVIAGEKGFWYLSGQGVYSYSLKALKAGTGASNAQTMKQVGNDIWAAGALGIAAISATEKFGDLQAEFPSAPIQSLWNVTDSTTYTINQTFFNQMKLVYSAREAVVILAVPLVADDGAESLFVYNTNTKRFLGQWEVNASAMAVVELASPVTEKILVGNASGQVAYFNPFSKRDFRTTGYEMEIETPALDGRSINPLYSSYDKKWSKLRLYILPRGEWNFTPTWWTDADKYVRGGQARSQNPQGIHTLDKDFRLDVDPDGILFSGGEMAVIEMPLDVQGRTLTINIKQSGTGEDFVPQGYEVDMEVLKFESDD